MRSFEGGTGSDQSSTDAGFYPDDVARVLGQLGEVGDRAVATGVGAAAIEAAMRCYQQQPRATQETPHDENET